MFKNWSRLDWSKKLSLFFLLFMTISLSLMVVSTLMSKDLKYSSASIQSDQIVPNQKNSEIKILKIEYRGDGNHVEWNYEGNPGVKFNVYRSEDPYFIPNESNLVEQTREKSFVDKKATSGTNYFYTVSALRGNDETFSGSYVGVWNHDIGMEEEGWVQISNPFLNFDNSIQNILGTQLYGSDSPQDSDRILVWNPGEKQYVSSWYCSGAECESWGEPWYNKWLFGNYAESDISIPAGRSILLQRRGGFEENDRLVLTGFLPEYGSLNYKLKYNSDPTWYFVSVPLYRPDIFRASDLVGEMPYALEFTTWDKSAQKYLCYTPSGSDAYCSDDSDEVDFSLEPLQTFWVRISPVDTIWP